MASAPLALPPTPKIDLLHIVRKLQCYSYTVPSFTAVNDDLEHVVFQDIDVENQSAEVYNAFVRKKFEGVFPPCVIQVINSCYVNVRYKITKTIKRYLAGMLSIS